MEVVRQVIEDELHLQIPIVGLAKNNRHRTSEVLFGFPPQTLGIKQGTPLSIYWKISRMRCTALPSPSTGKKKQKPDCLCTRPYQRCRRQAENSPAENIQECGPHPASQLGRDCRSDWRKCSEKRQGITIRIQIICYFCRNKTNHMRVVIQRVTHASVTIDGICKSAIKEGFMILLGIEAADSQEDADWLCKKIVNLRVLTMRMA